MSNMYQLSVYQWNPFVGCRFDCLYCRKSFQAQAKRQKHICPKCFTYEPHEHPERLDIGLPETGYMQFIFICSMGDISFCSTEYLEQIVAKIERNYYKTFLIQSKNPKTFKRIDWPKNVILGTTIETDMEYETNRISKAPSPWDRYKDLSEINHDLKMVTIEPIMSFGNYLFAWIKELNPCMVWIGRDSKRNHLAEPSLEKIQRLHWELSKLNIPVILKRI